jgi:transcriptional regulator with XRE-family HTH domain
LGAKVSPLAGVRRVAGLRREEVALLAGVSVPYYTRLERGDARDATDAVLDAISRALLREDAERAYLFDLVRAANATAAAQPTRPARPPVRPELRNMLEAMSGRPGLHPQRPPGHPRRQRAGPGLVRADLHQPGPAAQRRRFTFLDPAAAGFYPDWDAVAGQNVASLRAEVGRNPYDKALSDLIGELSTRGDTFRQRWARHQVRRHRADVKCLNHPARRADDVHLRDHGIRRRRGPVPHRVRCRTRQPGHRCTQPAGQLERHRQRRKHSAQAELSSRSGHPHNFRRVSK